MTHTSWKTKLAVVAFFAALSAAPDAAQSRPCGGSLLPDVYPDVALSPQESLSHHDAVFLAEVAVPAKKCSLGYCAGLKVLRTLKGDVANTALVRVPAADATCGPSLFKAKGGTWMVFANGGTSKTGYRYLQVAEDGPSFASQTVPDFEALEYRYRAMRAKLDQAIDAKLR